MSASPLGSNGGTNVAGRDNCFQYSYSSLPSHQCGLRNNFESIIFILQNPQKDIRIKIYLSIFSLITKTTSTNPSQFPYPPLSRHCYNQWWGRCKMIQKEIIASDCAKPGEENVTVIYRLPRNSVERPDRQFWIQTNQPVSCNHRPGTSGLRKQRRKHTAPDHTEARGWCNRHYCQACFYVILWLSLLTPLTLVPAPPSGPVD